MDIQNLIDQIKNMTVLELNEVVKALEEEFGVSASAPVAVAVAAGGAGEAVVEEQTEFDVILKDAGNQKIKVIKVVRETVAGLGLKEAKELVEAAPKAIKEGVTKEEANELKAKFEEVGAVIEIK